MKGITTVHATIRLLLWGLLLQNYGIVQGKERLLGVARQLLLSESTTEKVKEKLVRILGRRQSPCCTLTGLPLPPSISTSSMPSIFSTKFIHQSSSTEALRHSVGNAVDPNRLGFWKTMLRNPKDVYSLLATIYLVATIQRRLETLFQAAKEYSVGFHWMQDWYVGGPLGMLVVLGVSYLGFQDSSLVRYGFSTVVTLAVVALLAFYHFKLNESIESTVDEMETLTMSASLLHENETSIEESSNSLDVSVAFAAEEMILLDENEAAEQAPMLVIEPEATMENDSESEAVLVKHLIPNMSEGSNQDENEEILIQQSPMSSQSVVERQVRPTLNHFIGAQFKTVQSFVWSVPQRVKMLVSDHASMETTADQASTTPTMDLVIAGTDVFMERYALVSQVVPSSGMAFFSRFQPTTIVQGLVAAVAGTLVVASYAFGLPLALPLLHDAAASILTWSIGGFVYDHVLSKWAGLIEDTVPDVTTPQLADCETTIQDVSPREFMDGSFAAQLRSDHLRALMKISHGQADVYDADATELESDLASAVPSNPPFQTVEVEVSSSPVEDDPLEVSVVQTQYFKPVQHLLRAILVAGGSASTSLPSKGNSP